MPVNKYLNLTLWFLTLFFSSPMWGAGQNPDYLKKPINLDFQNVPVRDALQILAKIGHKNIIVSHNIHNNITLHLENIPWKKALDIILKEQNLGLQVHEQIFTIASLEEFSRQDELAPLTSQMVFMRYAKAADIANLIKSQNKSLVSERGSVLADPRTNALWISDIDSKLKDIRKFIHEMDIPVKQVLIEARIVTIDKKYEQELGVRFGLTHPRGNLTNESAGADQTAQHLNSASIDNPLARLNVDLPSNSSNAGSIGLAIAALSSSNLLDLELSALETEGAAEIISRPRIITSDQQAATILSGQAIPYQESTKSGATSIKFEKAALSLTVIPQIMPDNKLLLSLQVNQDRPGAIFVQGVPEIDTREIKTQVLIKNHQTLVLGGIYEQSRQNRVERVPFLSKLPVIGYLFQHTIKQNSQQELLIFVTPEIMRY